MGRFTLTQDLLPKLFPGLRSEYPVFELPRQANAKDLFLALRSEIEGEMAEGRLNELLTAWPADDSVAQASILFGNLNHFARINQPVVLKSARAIRDIGHGEVTKRWVASLFNELLKTPDLKLFWISELTLPLTEVDKYKNVLQVDIAELSAESIFMIMSELLEVRDSVTLSLAEISKKINGHPATARYVVDTIQRGQRSPEAIIADPKFLVSYQQQFVEELLEKKNLDDAEFGVLHLLSLFLPWTSSQSLLHFGRSTMRKLLGHSITLLK
jgi:hypothetical protein